ncbi:MAG: two-component regulator propeller domain-containing protein [Ferruginibacter sp.]
MNCTIFSIIKNLRTYYSCCKRKHLFLLLLPSVFYCCSVTAQTSYHLSTSHGLTTNQLTVLIKDRQNNMWFGSYSGLYKNEGTSIKVYTKSGSGALSLSSREMHAVFEDRLGFIWVGTTGGLDKLDPKTGAILHYELKGNSQMLVLVLVLVVVAFAAYSITAGNKANWVKVLQYIVFAIHFFGFDSWIDFYAHF